MIHIAELALSPKEVAKLLGLSLRTVYQMVYDGKLPAKRVTTTRGRGRGGKIIVPRYALEKWLNEPDKPNPKHQTKNQTKRREVGKW